MQAVLNVYTLAEFIDTDWGDKVNSGIGSYWLARLHRTAGRYDNPILELTLSPQSGIYEFGYWARTPAR
jgi:hypothetical protein